MMKRKILVGALSVLVSLGAAAQRVNQEMDRSKDLDILLSDPVFDRSLPENQMRPDELKNVMRFKDHIKSVNQANAKAGLAEGIVDFGSECDTFAATSVFIELTGTGECFPDSTVMIHFSNADRHARYHGFGGTYDPQTPVAAPLTFDRTKDTVQVDTIYFSGGYRRFRTLADDTFHIEIVKGDLLNGDPSFSLGLYSTGTFTNQTHQTNLTSLNYINSSSHGFHLGIDGVGVLHEKIVLTDGDDQKNVWKVPVNITLEPGEGLGVFISLELGEGSYTAGETIDLVNETGPNFFRQFIWRNIDDNDNNSYFVVPHAYDDQYTTHGTTRTGGGMWLFNKSRYGEYTGGDAWRNDRINNYGGALANDIMYYVRGVSSSTVGVKEVAANNVELGQNMPNPFGDISRINYTVKSASNVRFEVYDITGKTVNTINEGRRSAGSYSVELDAEDYESGVYYYTMFTDAGKMTRKMIVVK